MERQIKLIWDFHGETALKIAEHHAIHLKEYIALEKLALSNVGTESLSPIHSIAFLVVGESQMIVVRDRLKPHRGELYIAKQ